MMMIKRVLKWLVIRALERDVRGSDGFGGAWNVDDIIARSYGGLTKDEAFTVMFKLEQEPGYYITIDKAADVYLVARGDGER